MTLKHGDFITACKVDDAATVKRWMEAYEAKPEARQRYGQMGLYPIHIAALCGSEGVFYQLSKACLRQVSLQAVPLHLARTNRTIIVPAKSTVLPFAMYSGSMSILRIVEKSAFVKTYAHDRYQMQALRDIADNASTEVKDWFEWFSSGGAKTATNSSGYLTSYASTVFESYAQ